MRAALLGRFAMVAAVSALSACVTSQQQADGSHKFNISFSGQPKANAETPAPAVAPVASEPARAPVAAPRSPVADKPQTLDAAARPAVQQALSCMAIAKRFDLAEAALKKVGWKLDGGVTPVVLATPLRVFGLGTSKIAIKRDGGEHIYRSHFSGVTMAQVVKAAALKPGKNGKGMGRVTKLGVLEAEALEGEIVLTCTVDTEG